MTFSSIKYTALLLFITVNLSAQYTVSFGLKSEYDRYGCKTKDVEFIITSTDTCPAGHTCTYFWDFGDGSKVLETADITDIVHTYQKDGVFSVTLSVYDTVGTDTLLASSSISNLITLYNPSEATLEYEIVEEDSAASHSFMYRFTPKIEQNHGDVWAYNLDFGNNIVKTPDSLNSIEYTFAKELYEPGYDVIFNVSLKTSKLGFTDTDLNEYGLVGCASSETYVVEVEDLYFDNPRASLDQRIPYQPNIFTPNNDGQNDLFFLNTNGSDEFSFYVYNRWGSLVYEIENTKTIEWTGVNTASEPLPTGTYFYIVRSNNSHNKHEMKGLINLFR